MTMTDTATRPTMEQTRERPVAYDTLVRDMLPDARAIACGIYTTYKRTLRPGIEPEDLMQDAFIALDKAAREYNGSVPFKAFATPVIRNAVLRCMFENYQRATRVPYYLTHHVRKLRKYERLHATTITDADEVRQILETTRRTAQEVLYSKNGRTAGTEVLATTPSATDETDDTAACLETICSALRPDEQQLLRRHYGDDVSSTELAQEQGLLRQTLEARMQRTLMRLRAHVVTHGIVYNGQHINQLAANELRHYLSKNGMRDPVLRHAHDLLSTR